MSLWKGCSERTVFGKSDLRASEFFCGMECSFVHREPLYLACKHSWALNKVQRFFVEDMPVEIALPKAWAKRLSEINSYRTDARHDLAKCITGEKNCHTVTARGVTTIVMDFKK